MIHKDLLTGIEAAQALDCTPEDLPTQQAKGRIETVVLHNQNYYRLQPASVAAEPMTVPSDKRDDRCNTSSSTDSPVQPSDAIEDEDFPIGEVNIALLLEQNKDRARLIDQLEQNHRLRMGMLGSILKHVRFQRLALLITLELAIGAAIIIGTLARDGLTRTQSQAWEMRQMALHNEQAYETLKAGYDQLQSRTEDHQNQLHQARKTISSLETQLQIEQVKFVEARKTISRLVRQNTLTDAQLTN